MVGLNYDNTDEQSDLSYTDEDLEDWKDFLTNKNFDEVRVLTDENGTDIKIRDHLIALSDSDSSNTVSVFAFSGHGAYVDADSDGDKESVIFGATNGKVISEYIDSDLDFEGGNDYLHFSACHSGGFEILGDPVGDNPFVGMAAEEFWDAHEDDALWNSIFTYYTLKLLGYNPHDPEETYDCIEDVWEDSKGDLDYKCYVNSDGSYDHEDNPVSLDGDPNTDVYF